MKVCERKVVPASSHSIIRILIWTNPKRKRLASHVARTRVGENRSALQGFGEQPEGMALFGTLSRRLKDDIKKDLNGPGWESID